MVSNSSPARCVLANNYRLRAHQDAYLPCNLKIASQEKIIQNIDRLSDLIKRIRLNKLHLEFSQDLVEVREEEAIV